MGRKKTSVQILTSDRTGFKTKILCWLKRNNQILLKRKTTASGCFWHTYFKLIRQRKINECVHLDTTFSFFTSCHWPPKLSASLVPLYFSAEHAVPCDMPSRAFHRVVIVTSTRTEAAGALHEGGGAHCVATVSLGLEQRPANNRSWVFTENIKTEMNPTTRWDWSTVCIAARVPIGAQRVWMQTLSSENGRVRKLELTLSQNESLSSNSNSIQIPKKNKTMYK